MTLKDFYRKNRPMSIRALGIMIGAANNRFWGWITGNQYGNLYKEEEKALKDYTRALRDDLNKIEDL